ncbi:MAG TPA: zf-HC2 domain-containing protein [Gemmatimonadales bacterium]|nr:zf-HC2 domain-containing protein [Gemmatimonadales bacterium]
MPHIPEDELHAYLDQALGRLRCVEIESHLAECTRCRDARDGIAALRDRTTALLARLAPRYTVVPAYADIRRQAQMRIFRQRRVLARLAWAASVVLALGIGWTASTLYRAAPASTPIAAAPADPMAPPEPVEVSAPAAQPEPAAAPAPKTRAEAPAIRPRLAAAPPASARAGEQSVEPWRTVTWNPAPGRSAEAPAPSADSAVPPAVVLAPTGSVVTQSLASGEVARAVGTPADVPSLLKGRPAPATEARHTPAQMPPAYTSGTLAIRPGGIAVGPSQISSDSVRAMMRRLNLMLRVR